MIKTNFVFYSHASSFLTLVGSYLYFESEQTTSIQHAVIYDKTKMLIGHKISKDFARQYRSSKGV